MRRFLFALTILVLTSSSVLADAKIPVYQRIKNQPPGYCCWASIETLCRHQGIKAGYDLLEKRKLDDDYMMPDGKIIPKNIGYDDPVAWKLNKLGIKYKMNATFSPNKAGVAQIKKAVDSGKGAVVTVYHGYPTTPECHCVTVVAMNDKEYEYIDSNDPGTIYVGSMEFFFSEWTGFVLTVEK